VLEGRQFLHLAQLGIIPDLAQNGLVEEGDEGESDPVHDDGRGPGTADDDHRDEGHSEHGPAQPDGYHIGHVIDLLDRVEVPFALRVHENLADAQ